MLKDKLIIGLIQSMVTEDLNLNLSRTVEKVRLAAARGAQIICLQELYRTLYFPQWKQKDASFLAETIPGESTDIFSALAKELKIVIIIPIFEMDNTNYYNSVTVINEEGELLKTYRKIHVPCDPLFYEKGYFLPGQEVHVYDTRFGKFAVLICYDQWFPEAARVAALKGAEIIFYPTAIGWIKGDEKLSEGDWHDAWETVQRANAISNGIHVAAVNRVGMEGDIFFWGSSFICDSFGKIIAKGSDKDEEILVAELDLYKNIEVREGWGFFRNRRPETYWPLVELQLPQERLERKELCSEDTPLKLGYHMPAEWERHEAIWLSWPYDMDSFPKIEKVEQSYVSLIEAIYKSEIVNLLVKDELMLNRAADLLKKAWIDLSKVRFHVLDYADVWFRDYGPTFVINREKKKLAMVAWIFNAWGEKYPELIRDARIPSLINDDLKLESFLPGIVLEGGSIEINGLGTVLTTEQCLLNKNRNPCLSKDNIEAYLMEYLGARKVIWLKKGIAGDDTDGHVDDIARFINPTTVLCTFEEDLEDENHMFLKENYELLRNATDQDGNQLAVIKLPMPGRIGVERRLPASYANFYIGNEVVLVPVFGHKNDDVALQIIQEAFRDRKVVGIGCRELIHGLGSIHCISQQQPKL